MRKLIVSNLVTLDGYYEGKDRHLNALFDYFHEDVHGHVESPTDGQLMVPIRGEPADGSPSPAHAKAVPRQGELVLQGAGTGPSAL